MTNSLKPKKKQKPFFSADVIATTMHCALRRDLYPSNKCKMDDSAPLDYLAQLQVDSFLKKYEFSTADADKLESEAFDMFVKASIKMFKVNGELSSSIPPRCPVFTSETPKMVLHHLRARNILDRVLGRLDREAWFTACKHSGGTSQGVSFQDTSPEAKWTFPITMTEEVQPLFVQYMAWDNSLAEAVKQFNLENPISDHILIVPGSRATTVGKSSTARRFINIEPTFNMFLEQGLMILAYDIMRGWGLNVKTLPELHKELARQGSLDLQSSTIDWSQASNLIASELVSRQFPVSWSTVLNQLRSKVVDIDGQSIPVFMFAAMGNATTFPVETLIFWAYAQAVHYDYLYPNTKSSIFPLDTFPFDKCSVFGDDCIVPTVIAEDYINVMQQLGCEVNDDKSFYGTIAFRESCGGDYLHGTDVRPYCLTRPDTERKSALEPYLNIMFNRLLDRLRHIKGKLVYIYESHAIRVLLAQYKKYNLRIRIIPDFYPDDAGVKISDDIQRLVTNYGLKSIDLAPISRSHHGTYSFSFCRYIYRETQGQSDAIRYNIWLKRPIIREYNQTRLSVLPLAGKKLKGQRAHGMKAEGQHVVVQLNILGTENEYTERKGGSYIVAKGITSHWDVPRLIF